MPRLAAVGAPTRSLRVASTPGHAGWMEPPPPRAKFQYAHTMTNVPGFPERKPDQDPYWLDSAISGDNRYLLKGPNTSRLGQGWNQWAGDAERGIPGMPPMNNFANPLVPREEAARFLPDIFIDGLADEIMGPLRKLAKHVVPHQFHQYHDESMVPEIHGMGGTGTDKARRSMWKTNYAMYVNRHPLADEMQRKMFIGDDRAQQLYQDPDDAEYEADIIAALDGGDIDQACTLYKRMMDPPRNWHIYTMLIQAFARRGLLADAVAVYDEMDVFGIPPSTELLCALVDCAAAAEHPLRAAWAAAEARGASARQRLPPDGVRDVSMRALRHLCAAGSGELAAAVWRGMGRGAAAPLDADIIVEKAAALAARARELALIPSDTPSAAPPHHHLYAMTLPNGAGSDAPAAAEEGPGAVGEGAVREQLAADAVAAHPELRGRRIDPAPMLRDGWSVEEVLRAVCLLEAHVSADSGLPDELPTERDYELPYFKKSKNNHYKKPTGANVIREFSYASTCLELMSPTTMTHAGGGAGFVTGPLFVSHMEDELPYAWTVFPCQRHLPLKGTNMSTEPTYTIRSVERLCFRYPNNQVRFVGASHMNVKLRTDLVRTQEQPDGKPKREKGEEAGRTPRHTVNVQPDFWFEDIRAYSLSTLREIAAAQEKAAVQEEEKRLAEQEEYGEGEAQLQEDETEQEEYGEGEAQIL